MGEDVMQSTQCRQGEGEREVLPQTWRVGSLPAGFEGGGREGGELGCDGEDAVEFPVVAGGCYGGGDACDDSVKGLMIVKSQGGLDDDDDDDDDDDEGGMYLVLPKRTSAMPKLSAKEMSRLR